MLFAKCLTHKWRLRLHYAERWLIVDMCRLLSRLLLESHGLFHEALLHRNKTLLDRLDPVRLHGWNGGARRTKPSRFGLRCLSSIGCIEKLTHVKVDSRWSVGASTSSLLFQTWLAIMSDASLESLLILQAVVCRIVLSVAGQSSRDLYRRLYELRLQSWAL